MIHDQALPEKAQIGVYEIQTVLGADPFTITYSGWNRHLNAPVVLQEYFPASMVVRQEDGHTVGPRSEAERAVYEARLASFFEQAQGLVQIEHHNLVRVHNALEAHGTAYLVMEHKEGIPLTQHCDPPAPLPEAELQAILLTLLEALQRMHEGGFVHGDVHPGNVRIRGDGQLLLIGFAIARLAAASCGGLSPHELRAGYAPPERYNSHGQPGAATDLYALGATMYRCITHAEPVAAPDRVAAIRDGQPDPLGFQEGSSPYSEGFLKAIQWLLRPEAKDRPRSASEVVASLTRDKAQGADESQQRDETPPSRWTVSPAMAGTGAGWWTVAGTGVTALLALSFWYVQQLGQGRETVTSHTASPLLTDRGRGGPFPGPPKNSAEAPTQTLAEPPQEMVLSAQPPLKSAPLQTRIPGRSGKPIAEAASTPKVPTETTRRSPPVAAADPQVNRPIATKTTLSEDTVKAIEQHLTAAEKDVAALRLTTPDGNNAYQHYRAVLTVVPGHKQALEGVQRIVDRYVWVIRKTMQEGRLDRARVFLNRAEIVSPSAPSLRSLREELAAITASHPRGQ